MPTVRLGSDSVETVPERITKAGAASLAEHQLPVTLSGKVLVPLTPAMVAAMDLPTPAAQVLAIADALDCPVPICLATPGSPCVTNQGYTRQRIHRLRWNRASSARSYIKAHPEVTR